MRSGEQYVLLQGWASGEDKFVAVDLGCVLPLMGKDKLQNTVAKLRRIELVLEIRNISHEFLCISVRSLEGAG